MPGLLGWILAGLLLTLSVLGMLTIGPFVLPVALGLIWALLAHHAPHARAGGLLGGAILTVVGLFVLRNPAVGAVALTLASGVTFFVSGLARMAWSFAQGPGRLVLFISGLVSLGLGFYVLFNLGAATFVLLGTLLGVQTALEGVTLIAVGRLRPKKD